MNANLIEIIERMSGMIGRDQNKNPIIVRCRNSKHHIYVRHPERVPRSPTQLANSTRFSDAAVATHWVYRNADVLEVWRERYSQSGGMFKGKHYKTLYGYIFANLLSNQNQ